MEKTIPWSQIKTAHGVATHIPDAIRRLNSEYKENRKEAYWQIDNFAVLQSDLYEAAYYVIEPVVELMEQSEGTNLLYVFAILTEIALGYADEACGSRIIEDNGISIPLEQACRGKLRELRSRIEGIEVYSDKEREEKQFLLDTMNSFSTA